MPLHRSPLLQHLRTPEKTPERADLVHHTHFTCAEPQPRHPSLLMSESFPILDVEGGDDDLRRLEAAGYQRVDHASKPGEYSISARDGGAGWASW